MGDRQDESLKQPAPSLNHHKGLCDYGSVSVLRWLAAIRVEGLLLEAVLSEPNRSRDQLTARHCATLQGNASKRGLPAGRWVSARNALIE